MKSATYFATDVMQLSVTAGLIFANFRRIGIDPEILRCYWLLAVFFLADLLINSPDGNT